MPPPEASLTRRAGASPFPSWAVRAAHWVTLLLLFSVGAAVRVLFLARKPFWFDETFSVQVARLDWPNFLHLLWWREANMSLYYVALRLWLHLGQSECFIRSLSVVFAVATLPAIYWLGKLLYDRRTAVIATALLAFNAYHIRYAQEARSYALLVLLATLSSAFLIAYLRTADRAHRLGYIVVSALAVYAHFYALLLVAAHWLALRWFGVPNSTPNETRRSISSELRGAWIGIGIAVLPLLVFVAKTGAGPIRWIPRPGLFDLVRFCIDVTDGQPVIYLMASLVAVLPFAKNLLGRNQNWPAWGWQFLNVWLLFPIALTLLLSFARPVFLPRYMIFCLPAMCLLVGAGLASIRPAWLCAGITIAVLIFSARMVPFVYDHDFDNERDGSGGASSFVLEHSQPGDGVIFHIADTRVAYEFFRTVRTGETGFSAAQLGPEILFPRHAEKLDYRDFTGKPTAEFLQTVPVGHARVWVMLMNNGAPGSPDPTTVMLTRLLGQGYRSVQRWQFPKVEVRLYSQQ